MTFAMKIHNRTVRVETCFDEAPHSGSIWLLFANYPNEFEANEAVGRALEIYPSVRVITEQLIQRKK